jgi:hypothetical protein
MREENGADRERRFNRLATFLGMPSHCPLPEGREARLAHWEWLGAAENCSPSEGAPALGPPSALAQLAADTPGGPALPPATPPVRFCSISAPNPAHDSAPAASARAPHFTLVDLAWA